MKKFLETTHSEEKCFILMRNFRNCLKNGQLQNYTKQQTLTQFKFEIAK